MPFQTAPLPDSSEVRDHFFKPRNVGELEHADATGEAGSISCGAIARFTLRVDESQIITDARFRAIGCSFMLGCASILTESVIGQTTAGAATFAQATEFLPPGSWPLEKTSCAELCRDALLSAIQHYSDARREEWIGDDALICSCFGVSEGTIERAIEAKNLTTIAEVTTACNAGAGCRSCYSLIQDILETGNREP